MNNNSTGTASGQLEIVQVDGEPFAERQPRMPKDGQPRAYRCSPARETARPTPCVRPGAIQHGPRTDAAIPGPRAQPNPRTGEPNRR